MDKFVIRSSSTVTPATVKKSNKRSIENITEEEEEKGEIDRSMENITEEDVEEDDDDESLDMNQDDMIAFTQAYYTQGVEDDNSDEEEEDDGTTTHFNFTQEEEIPALEPPPPLERRRDSFHKDTAYQVSIDYMGTQRIFKLGESFTSDKLAGRLCKEKDNVVVQGTTEAVYTIQQFTPSSLRKKAKCRVRIPVYETIPEESEKKRIQQLYPNEYVTLFKPETIELRHLLYLVPENHPALVAPDPLVWSVTGLEAPMTRLNVTFEEPKYRRKSFHMLADYERPTALDLFAGAGGMSTGFTNAGFDVRWLVEKDPQAAATLKLNHRQGRIFEERVENFLAKARAGRKLYPTPNEVHHVHASSPCQGTQYLSRSELVDQDICAFVD